MKVIMTKRTIDNIFNGMSDLLVRKNEDYKGASFDLGIDGNFVHIWDKVSRLRHLIENKKNGKTHNFESIEDTYRDLIGYCVIGLHILNADKNEESAIVSKLDEIGATYLSKNPVNSEEMKDICAAFKEGVKWTKENM